MEYFYTGNIVYKSKTSRLLVLSNIVEMDTYMIFI